MDFATGALGKLPSKLLELLKDEYKLQKGVKSQVEFLSRELESIYTALCKVAQVPPDQLDPQVKLWARRVREASYDIEDVVDTFLVRVEGAPTELADSDKVKRLLKKMGKLFSLSKIKVRRHIAGAIEDIKINLQEIKEQQTRYKVDDVVGRPASIDPRLQALYKNASQLVGIDEQRDKLIKMLSTEDNDDSDKKTKMVSVVGFGGLGKTTLAKVVYEELKQDIEYKAFVPVGRDPDMKKVLRDILIGLDKDYYAKGFNFAILDERQLTDELREFLENKRYFIVIDDIWDVSLWDDTIRYALYDNGLGSKVIITTRNHDVAQKVGSSYKMQPLRYPSSKKMFYERIFGSESQCPSQLCEVSEMILKKCGGVPLAIITTSSLLANKPINMKEWSDLCDSIGSGLESSQDMGDMRKILSLSYHDLPPHLKTCLLYLSIFPEDYKISGDRLIKRWIAEDFVHGDGRKSLYEVGKSFFNEPTNRSLIQPVLDDMDDEGNIFSFYRVHDMVLDLICSLSREENFVTMVLGDSMQKTHPAGSKVRRLSLQNDTWPTMNASKLRSLSIFGSATINSVPSLSSYHLLRVLVLEDCNLKDHPNLTFVANLFHMRYLSLSNTGYAGELPVEIWKLKFLQTLDLFNTEIKELPSSIVELGQLMCLYVAKKTRLPNGLMKLASLEELIMIDVDSASIVEELGHLTLLRRLWIRLRKNKEGRIVENLCCVLVESLGNLKNIQLLAIKPEVMVNLDGLVEPYLGNLGFLWIAKTIWLPKWINPSSLPLLTELAIGVGQVREEDIRVLGMLPSLRVVEVEVLGTTDDIQSVGRFTVSANAFPCVRECSFSDFGIVPSMFPPGAMSMLEEFEFNIRLSDFSSGQFSVKDLALGHLPSLQKVMVYIYRCDNDEEAMVPVDKTEIRDAMLNEVNVHPNHPDINIF